MITRFYFVSFKSGAVNGNSTEGYFTVTTKSWFPRHGDALTKAREYIEDKKIPNGFIITQFYRV
jgi:hypothetical protein